MERNEPESTAACERHEMVATDQRCACRDCAALDEWDGGSVEADLAAAAAVEQLAEELAAERDPILTR